MKKTIIKDWVFVKILCSFFTIMFSVGILIYCLVENVNYLGYLAILFPIGLFGMIYIFSLLVVKNRHKDIVQLNNNVITGYEEGKFFEYKWSDVEAISVHKFINDNPVASIMLAIIGMLIRPFYVTVKFQIRHENKIKQIKFEIDKRTAKKLQAMINNDIKFVNEI